MIPVGARVGAIALVLAGWASGAASSSDLPAAAEARCATTQALDIEIELGNPPFFAVDSDGTIYFHDDGTIVGRDPATGTDVYVAVPDESFFRLIDLAVSRTGEVVALDGAGRIVRFDALGSQIGAFGTGDINTGESSVAVDDTGRIWVADPFTDSVRAFTPDGTVVVDVVAEPSLERPGDIEVAPSGDVYVLDGYRELTYVFDADGAQLITIPLGHVNTATGSLAVDLAGRLHVADPFRTVVHVFTPDGSPLTSVRAADFSPALRTPRAIEAHPDGSVIVADPIGAGWQAVRTDPDLVPVVIGVEVEAIRTTASPGDVVEFAIAVTSAGECPLGPFELRPTVTAGLDLVPDPHPVWLVVELGGASGPRADLLATATAIDPGRQGIDVRLTGPGVVQDASAQIEVIAPPTTPPTTPPPTTAPPPTTPPTTPPPTTVPPTFPPPIGTLPPTGGTTVTAPYLPVVVAMLGVALVAVSLRSRRSP